MTTKQMEEKVIDLKHREPFFPFVVEMADGLTVTVPHAGLAITETGFGFFGPDGAIVNVDFNCVRNIRLNTEAAA